MASRDIIISLIIFIIATIIKYSNLVNTVFREVLIEIIRFGPTLWTLYLMYPKNYMRSLSYFWRRKINVEYAFTIKLDDYILHEKYDVKDIICYIKDLDIKRIILLKEELKSQRYIFQVDNANVILDFKSGIYIYSKYDVNYNTFYDKISYLIDVVDCVKSKFGIEYNPLTDGKVSIEIIYIDDKSAQKIHCTNPLWKKIFKGYNIQSSDMTYVTNNKSRISISSSSIYFCNNKLELLDKDINKELFSCFNRRRR